MAQLRQDYAEFTRRGAEVVCVGPDGPNAFKRYWEENGHAYIGLADVGSKVADLYNQEVNLFKLGRMPAVFVIDKEGTIRYSHYGSAMYDIPENTELFKVLDQVNAED
jgi:peroxiredoxin